MKTATALILVCGSCGAGFFAGWMVFHNGGTCKVEIPPEPQAQRVEPREEPKHATEAPSELERPDSRLSIAPAPPAPADPVPVAAKTEPTMPVAPADPSDPRNLPESTLAEMQAKEKAIREYLNQRTAPLLMQRFQDGLSEHVSDDPVWRGGDSDWEKATIYGIQGGPDVRGLNRTVLPREQYPELYAFKDDSIRLQKSIVERALADQQGAMTPR